MTLWPLDDVNEADRNRACALLEWLLQSEPSQRPSSAAQVLDHPFFSHGWSKAGPGLNGEYVDELNASVEVVESEARGSHCKVEENGDVHDDDEIPPLLSAQNLLHTNNGELTSPPAISRTHRGNTFSDIPNMRAILLSDSAEGCRAEPGQEGAEAPLDFLQSAIAGGGESSATKGSRKASLHQIISEPKTESAGGGSVFGLKIVSTRHRPGPAYPSPFIDAGPRRNTPRSSSSISLV